MSDQTLLFARFWQVRQQLFSWMKNPVHQYQIQPDMENVTREQFQAVYKNTLKNYQFVLDPLNIVAIRHSATDNWKWPQLPPFNSTMKHLEQISKVYASKMNKEAKKAKKQEEKEKEKAKQIYETNENSDEEEEEDEEDDDENEEDGLYNDESEEGEEEEGEDDTTNTSMMTDTITNTNTNNDHNNSDKLNIKYTTSSNDRCSIVVEGQKYDTMLSNEMLVMFVKCQKPLGKVQFDQICRYLQYIRSMNVYIVIHNQRNPTVALSRPVSKIVHIFDKPPGQLFRVFSLYQLMYNPLEHVSVYPHRVLSPEEEKTFFETYKTYTKETLPLLPVDAIAKYLLIEPDKVVEVTLPGHRKEWYVVKA